MQVLITDESCRVLAELRKMADEAKEDKEDDGDAGLHKSIRDITNLEFIWMVACHVGPAQLVICGPELDQL